LFRFLDLFFSDMQASFHLLAICQYGSREWLTKFGNQY
jgi:hypothetical protein